MYVGEDLNRNCVLDDNERDGSYRLPADDEDNFLQPGVIDIFTVYGDGKVNINTAPQVVLASLPGLDDQAAGFILNHRAGPDGRFGTEDDAGIENAEGISNIEGLTDLQKELLQQYCCFSSECFRIFCWAGLKDPLECCLAATVIYSDEGVRLLYVERLL
jgi:hypothetical protein